MQFTCVVNSVGPTSGDFEANFLPPNGSRSFVDPSTVGPLIILTLSDTNNAFQSTNFLVDQPISNAALAVALAAISTGNQVLADVDWPQPVETDSRDSTSSWTLPVYCHSLWLIGG